jgi:hypothetical protein
MRFIPQSIVAAAKKFKRESSLGRPKISGFAWSGAQKLALRPHVLVIVGHLQYRNENFRQANWGKV